MGMSRYTASRLKVDTEAILPVLKKAEWRRKSEKSEIRRSESVNALICCARAGVMASV